MLFALNGFSANSLHNCTFTTCLAATTSHIVDIIKSNRELKLVSQVGSVSSLCRYGGILSFNSRRSTCHRFAFITCSSKRTKKYAISREF